MVSPRRILRKVKATEGKVYIPCRMPFIPGRTRPVAALVLLLTFSLTLKSFSLYFFYSSIFKTIPILRANRALASGLCFPKEHHLGPPKRKKKKPTNEHKKKNPHRFILKYLNLFKSFELPITPTKGGT